MILPWWRGEHEIYCSLLRSRVPSHCVCGASFSTNHAMICRHGGLTFSRHNELRDLTGSMKCAMTWLLSLLYSHSLARPLFLHLLISEINVRADIRARGFWGRWMTECIFDIRVFHPNAPSYRQTQVGSLYCRHKLEKKREYGDHVCSVELACFTLLIFSTFGGLGREASIFYSWLANLLAVRHNTQYSQILSWMQCTISFSLLQSAILAIRGSRTLTSVDCPSTSTELCLVESHIDFTV